MARAVKKAHNTLALQNLSQQFKVLADPTRLIILSEIAAGRVRVGAFAEATGMTQGAISHHVVLLRLSKFVETNRVGRQVIYALTDRGRRFLASAESFLS